MRGHPKILLGDIRCVIANDKDLATGLLAYVSFRIGDVLVVDGVVVRRTRDGRTVLSWPSRTDSAGRRHPFVRLVDDDVRQAIERAVLGQLGQRPDLGLAKEADHD